MAPARERVARHRVIVGVTGSLVNLHALRQGVSVARSRGAVLYAVRVWENDNNDRTAFATAHKPEVVDHVARVDQAFAEALGGRPRDLDVRVVVVEGVPEVRLVRVADRDTDLLVVGASRPSWRVPFTGSVAGRIVRHARCPVLVVPPTEMGREAAAGPGLIRAIRPRTS